MPRPLFNETHELFRNAFRQFVDKEVLPNVAQWEQAGIVDKAMFRRAGDAGFLGMAAPAEWGGGGAADFRFNLVVMEEFAAAGVGALIAELPQERVGIAALGIASAQAVFGWTLAYAKDRPRLAGRPRPVHLRGHHRDHEGDHRPVARCLKPVPRDRGDHAAADLDRRRERHLVLGDAN